MSIPLITRIQSTGPKKILGCDGGRETFDRPGLLERLRDRYDDKPSMRLKHEVDANATLASDKLRALLAVVVGGIANNILTLAYTLNGIQYPVYLEISTDGNWFGVAMAARSRMRAV